VEAREVEARRREGGPVAGQTCASAPVAHSIALTGDG
jgi:hypothetical protein